MSSLTRKKAWSSSVSQPRMLRCSNCSSVRGCFRRARPVSGTERPRLSLPPGTLTLRDYISKSVSLYSQLDLPKFMEGHCPTFSNHSTAFGGRLYRFAWARISWAKEGKIASKSARLVVEAILGNWKALKVLKRASKQHKAKTQRTSPRRDSLVGLTCLLCLPCSCCAVVDPGVLARTGIAFNVRLEGILRQLPGFSEFRSVCLIATLAIRCHQRVTLTERRTPN